jgi:hypothetical protein
MGKESVLGYLCNSKIITEEQYADLTNRYAVVIVDREPTFGARVRKWFGYDQDNMKDMHTYAMVEFLLQKQNKDENDS